MSGTSLWVPEGLQSPATACTLSPRLLHSISFAIVQAVHLSAKPPQLPAALTFLLGLAPGRGGVMPEHVKDDVREDTGF